MSSFTPLVSSSAQCCGYNIQNQLIHLDAGGTRLLANLPFGVDTMVVDKAGNLFALAEGPIAVSPDAIQGGSCGGPAYIEVSPTGQQLFATYLPGDFASFDGGDAQGTPFVDIAAGKVQVVQDQPATPAAGCVVDAAGFGNPQKVSPGAIVTIFGSGLGPNPGVGFELVDGHAPTSLGGTQVLVNGDPAPILYSPYGQLNLILPYSLPVGTTPTIQVVVNETPLNGLSNSQVKPADITIFQVNGAAVALNQDGTVNSPQNPAQPGSSVMLFGTGGGQTSPPSVAGEVTPLGLRPLVDVPQAEVLIIPMPGTSGPLMLSVEYAGAAPSLLSGVTQINVKLPAVIPVVTGYPAGTIPLDIFENGVSLDSNIVTISVRAN